MTKSKEINLTDIWLELASEGIIKPDCANHHIEKIKSHQEADHIIDPVIHCDVMGTLVNSFYEQKKNAPLFHILKRLQEAGREIVIISNTADAATPIIEDELTGLGLNEVKSKDRLALPMAIDNERFPFVELRIDDYYLEPEDGIYADVMHPNDFKL